MKKKRKKISAELIEPAFPNSDKSLGGIKDIAIMLYSRSLHCVALLHELYSHVFLTLNINMSHLKHQPDQRLNFSTFHNINNL